MRDERHGGRIRFRIERTAMFAPPERETAADLSPRLGRSEAWIIDRTGVRERRIAREPMEQMAARVARELLVDGPPDLIVNASLTPVQLIPDSSVFVQRELGLSGIPSFSVHATCLSFLVGLNVVAGFVSSGTYQRVLLVSSEQGSVSRDFGEPESAALIGDGAAGALIVPTDEPGVGILGFAMKTFPEGADYAEFTGAGTRFFPRSDAYHPDQYLFRMRGPRLWRLAVTHVNEVLDLAFARAGLARSEVDVVIPHQASGPMLAVIPSYGFAADKVVDLIPEFGNCIAASLPMALHRAIETGRLKRGQTALLFGTGAGLSIGAAILRY